MPRRIGWDEWTPYEIQVQKRYERCLAAGGHVPSSDEIIRDKTGQPTIFVICKRCQVPYHYSAPQPKGKGSSPPKLRTAPVRGRSLDPI